jgi:hypothetical protein
MSENPVACLALYTALCASAAPVPYPVVDTGQEACYDTRREIVPPKRGEPFYGQDAQHAGRTPSYALSADGLTVADRVTGLTWQRSPDTDRNGTLDRADKLKLSQAQGLPATLNAARFGGFSDWRLPTIKELYSLIRFDGVDPSGPETDPDRLKPFIDTAFFKFAYGNTDKGERLIDSQYASCTKYVGKSFKGFDKLFGVNFADGRIKGYDLLMPGGGQEKTFFVQCVRGNPKYGVNEFRDNGDGTVTDRATGLMWAKGDSGKGMDWEAALAWVQARNGAGYLGHRDWRLPNAKELQSLVDYARSPDTTASPALSPVFACTAITNEIGKTDYPYYWSGTTHASAVAGGSAVYVAFGRAAGWPSGKPGQGGGPGRGGPGGGGPGAGRPDRGGPREGGPPPFDGQTSGSANRQFTDVHGAGSQRSDPKTGDASAFPYGRGPQGDVIRINNFVRCVRDAAPSVQR